MSNIVLRCHYRTAVALGMEPLEPHLHGVFLPVLDDHGEAWAWTMQFTPNIEEISFCLILKQNPRVTRRLSGGPDRSESA
jgi:hypothetical protein